MPTKPIIRTPSFIPSIYPYQLTVTLSTSAPPSVLSLPRHQLVQESCVDAKHQQTATSVVGVDIKESCAITTNGEAIPEEM
jgi:hypothetical protein